MQTRQPTVEADRVGHERGSGAGPGNGAARGTDPRFEEKPLRELVRNLSHDSSTLVRQETELFRREMEQRIEHAQKQAIVLGSGGIVAYVGGLTLVAFVILALAEVMPAWTAALIVGLALAISGTIAVLRGKKQLQEESFKPEQSARSIKMDIRTVREAAR